MVRPGARRGDDDLGAVTDRTGQVEGRAVTASSRGVRGRHSTSDISSTSTSYDPYAHTPSLPIRMSGLDPTQHFSRTQIPLNDSSGPGLQLGAQFFEQLAGSLPMDSSYSNAEYRATARGNSLFDVGPAPGKGKGLTGSFMSVMSKIAGSRQKRSEKSRPPTNPTQRKKSKNDGWEQTGPADGGPQDPVIVPSYSGHDRGILKSRSRCVSPTGWTPSDPAVLHSVGGFAWGAAALAYLYRSLGQASRTDANELSGCWSLLEGC
ncbi:hypothetical protein M9H77_09076 [Catharanthus roseus]|uniref:Uncharacterized protein n=1 Tax=Catharanthus roseus TaxID=4058 RepID=A0ACC0BZS0_CATRO|nr:hypothetical protein M9H77_09076 [Catharanthus roseus]